MKIDAGQAAQVLREEADLATIGPVDGVWLEKFERLSQLCERADVRTHIAFMGTALIAKSVSARADLFAIKPDHAPDNPNAFSARSLCHGVLVPLAAELDISLGVTGREPLNNQPYFRMVRLDDATPVRASSRPPFDYMLQLVREIDANGSELLPRQALRAFISVRRGYQLKYADALDNVVITPGALTCAIKAFVADNSEGGRRAQAVAAGLFDVFAGPERVESGRINDPSRKYPGDVCIRNVADPGQWEKAVEVRDKPVRAADVQIFGAKCIAMGVREAAVLMAAENQPSLDEAVLTEWATKRGLNLTLFLGWDSFVEQVLFWSGPPKANGAAAAVEHIRARLVVVEASPRAVEMWQRLVTG